MNLDSVRLERSMGASTMDKRSSPDAKSNDTPSPGQDDSSSGQDSPTPKSKKVRVELRTLNRKDPATTRNTSKKTPVTKRTASKKAKRKNPSVDRVRLQTPPISKIRTRQSLPNSWAEASASDILMFELRKQGAEFPAITEALRATCGLNYLSRTLRNRHWKIETRIGEMPDNLQASKTGMCSSHFFFFGQSNVEMSFANSCYLTQRRKMMLQTRRRIVLQRRRVLPTKRRRMFPRKRTKRLPACLLPSPTRKRTPGTFSIGFRLPEPLRVIDLVVRYRG